MALQRWRLLTALLCVLVQTHRASSSQEIMHKLTKGFIKVFDECKKELSLGDNIIQDFMNYWKEDYELLNRDIGCVIMCMASKHDLVTEDSKLHHENAHGFAKTHGADDDLAKQLVTMIHECEVTHTGIADDCMKMLEVAKCFRVKIHKLKWAPDMETIIEELMSDVLT